MIAKSIHRPVLETARVLVCAGPCSPLVELLASPDGNGPEVMMAADAAVAAEQLLRRSFDACLVDVDHCGTNVDELVGRLRGANAATSLVVFTSDAELAHAAARFDPGVEVVNK